ncbi:energy-coupling factor ABC transporter permease [Anoxybacillus flavithermus]|uniref:Cobalt transport protein CbiM n=1 Tax=Anoxybacillus flavithermus AK1 TaxID=1297581 RepID=M8D7E4_9BACL|nr:cobalt transport protein CbiM [Anoxybacillus flavithermus AK1]
MKRNVWWIVCTCLTVYVLFALSPSVYAMHIMEGFLPWHWALVWWLLFLPLFFVGLRTMTRIVKKQLERYTCVYIFTSGYFSPASFAASSSFTYMDEGKQAVYRTTTV